ncbi:MAG: flap endonuclease Xni [Bacterioplanes sp.]|nr:flap endonuclease Xni [Bacterioplanes sp.]
MKLLIVDAMNLIRRMYAAAEGSATQLDATQSRCLAAIDRNIEALQATHVVMVFEQHGDTWRHQLYADYKLGRKPMPEALAHALPDVRRYFEQAGIASLYIPHWEADDVIATLANKAALTGVDVVIMSTDKGFCQLVNARIRVRNHFERFDWDEERVTERFALRPSQLVDFWAMTGDSTNHLPGVAGIGPKTAGQLLDQHQELDRIFCALPELEERWQQALQKHWQDALLTRVLARLRLDVPLGIHLRDLRCRKAH